MIMGKSIFEKMECCYMQCGDYYLPDLYCRNNDAVWRIWALRHLYYISHYRIGFYTGLLLSQKLDSYLKDLDVQANDLFFCLVEQYKIAEGITEQMKSENQMEWVCRMNNIYECASAVVNEELIYV